MFRSLLHSSRGIFACGLTVASQSVYCERNSQQRWNDSYADVIVVGGGVVGLAVANELTTKHNARVIVIEKEDTVAAGASSGNSGLGCTGYDAPVGSLERRLLRRSIRIHQNLYRSFGLSHEHVNKCGSLVVAWTPEELDKLQSVLMENVEAGDTDVELLTKEELRQLEPALSQEALGAVYLPREAVVEPWLVPMAYARNACLHGAKLRTGEKVVDAQFNDRSKLWTVLTTRSLDQSVGRSTSGQLLTHHPNNADTYTSSANDKRVEETEMSAFTAKVVINCAGLYGDEIEKFHVGDGQCCSHSENSDSDTNATFKITPRKGQFVVFSLSDRTNTNSVDDLTHIIEPVASEFTKGVIIWRTMYGNIIVGPTAVNVESKSDRSTDSGTVDMLRKYGERAIPALRNAEAIGTYSGLRPATQYRDYQIYPCPAFQWITVGGIRSTGLTASSGIGEYVGQLYSALIKASPVKGEGEGNVAGDGLVGVTYAALHPEDSPADPDPPVPFPTLHQLAISYKINQHVGRAGDVSLFGKDVRVTHPISSFGMETFEKR